MIELCQVSDIRAGGIPKDMKLANQLFNRHGESLEEKSLTICSGTDYININYQHVICPSAELAKVRENFLKVMLNAYICSKKSFTRSRTFSKSFFMRMRA